VRLSPLSRRICDSLTSATLWTGLKWTHIVLRRWSKRWGLIPQSLWKYEISNIRPLAPKSFKRHVYPPFVVQGGGHGIVRRCRWRGVSIAVTRCGDVVWRLQTVSGGQIPCTVPPWGHQHAVNYQHEFSLPPIATMCSQYAMWMRFNLQRRIELFT